MDASKLQPRLARLLAKVKRGQQNSLQTSDKTARRGISDGKTAVAKRDKNKDKMRVKKLTPGTCKLRTTKYGSCRRIRDEVAVRLRLKTKRHLGVVHGVALAKT